MADTIVAPATVRAETKNPTPYDIRTEIFNGLIKRGLTPQQAMGSIYGLMGESSTALDPNSHGDNGRSIGIGQWNDRRRANLESLAASMGTTWNDPHAQVAHLFNELDGPEKAALDRIKSGATTAADATNLWTAGFERPATNNWKQRYLQGSQAGRLDADGNPTWTTGPAAPLPAAGPMQGPNEPAAPATSGAQDFMAAAKKGDVGGALAALTKGKEDEGGKGGLGNLGDQLGKSAPAPQASQMLAPAADAQGGQAQAGQALLGQILEQSSKPLSWSSRPYGANAGPQIPGTTLNQMGT